MAQSSAQPKKQGNRKSSGGGVGGTGKGVVGPDLEKRVG